MTSTKNIEVDYIRYFSFAIMKYHDQEWFTEERVYFSVWLQRGARNGWKGMVAGIWTRKIKSQLHSGNRKKKYEVDEAITSERVTMLVYFFQQNLCPQSVTIHPNSTTNWGPTAWIRKADGDISYSRHLNDSSQSIKVIDYFYHMLMDSVHYAVYYDHTQRRVE